LLTLKPNRSVRSCNGNVGMLWLPDSFVPSDYQFADDTTAKCNYFTGSLWECLTVVRPESQGGQIPGFTGPRQWPAGAPGRTWERWRQACDHMGAPTTTLGMPATTLGALPLTVLQSARNNLFFGNTVGAPGNHSYYLSFNDFWNSCILFVLSSVYLFIYVATHLRTVYLDWLKAVLESNSRCAWRWQLSELRDTLGGGYCVNLERHLQGMIERVSRCTRGPWSSELRDAIGGHNQASLEIYMEAAII